MHSCGNIWHDIIVNGMLALPYITFPAIWAVSWLRRRNAP